MRFASVEPSAATVHWTVALRWFESFPSGIIKRVIPFGITLFMIRRKGLDQSWFRSVKLSRVALIRATFNFSSPFLFAKIKDAVDCIIHCVFYWYAERDSNPRPTDS